MEDAMTAAETRPEGGADAYARARELAEQALHEPAIGHLEVADRLGAEALRLDPAAVADILAEHDAAHEPDARDRRTADHDAERIVRPVAREGQAPPGAGTPPGRGRP
jgi:hypothetical protein